MTTEVERVFVHDYLRFRLGRVEHVCEHFRSYPDS